MMRRVLPWLVLLLFVASGCSRLRGAASPATATPQDATAAAVAAGSGTPTPSPTPAVEALAQRLEGDSWQARLSAGLAVPDRQDIPVAERVDLLMQGLTAEAEHPSQDSPPNAYLPASAVTSLQLTRALSALGPGAIPALREAAAQASGEAHDRALIALAYAGDQDVAPQVRELLAGAVDPSVRMDAARALGQLGDEGAIPYLADALQDPYVVTAQSDVGPYTIYPVREQAIGALDALGVALQQRADGSYEIGE